MFEQVMNCGQETRFGDQETQMLSIYRFANNKGCQGWTEEIKRKLCKLKNIQNLREVQNCGVKDKGDSGGGGGIRIGTLSLESY